MSQILGIEKNLVVPNSAAPRAAASSEIQKLEIIDPDTIECLEYRVLLKVCEVQEITEGGIFKPESFFTKELFNKTEAIFISGGTRAFTDSDGAPLDNAPKSGDRVMTTKYAGNVYRDENNNLYRFANDKDVVAIVSKS